MAWIPSACPGECPRNSPRKLAFKTWSTKKLEGKISMPVYCNQDDSREFEEIFWGFVTQFLTFHAGHWCEVKWNLRPEVWRWPSTAQEGHLYGPWSPHAGGEASWHSPKLTVDPSEFNGPGGTVPCTSLGGPYLSCWDLALLMECWTKKAPCLM